MKKNPWLHNLLIILILGGYVWMTLRLYFSGKVTFYVHPDFAVLPLISGGFLLLVLFLLIVSLGFKSGKGLISHSFSENKFKLILAIFPLILFVFFPPKALSSQAFVTRSVSGSGDLGLSRQMARPAEFVINTENRQLIDWIRLFAQNAEPDTYANMKAHLTGFVLKDGSLPDDYFMISRFVISCCAADARPIGLPVRYDRTKFSVYNDQWLDLKGSFVVEEINGERRPILVLNEAKEIEVPDNPYVS